MCSSKPKIPNSKTPPAPGAPEPSPDAPLIGGDRRGYYRSRGLAIPARPDLSGLGNQQMSPAAQHLYIRPGSTVPQTPVQIAEANILAEQKRNQVLQNSKRERTNGRRR